jgi:DNA polymerase-3 subunit gamma/tau
MRDALSILDTCAGVDATVDAQTVRRMAGVTDQSYLFELSDAVAAKEPVTALALVAQLRERSVEVKRLCDELILHYRNILLAGVSGDGSLLMGVSAEDEARYREAAHTVSQAQAVRAIRTLCEALDKMGKSVDARIELELALFQLCGDEPQPTALPVSMAAPAAVQRSVNSGAPVPFAVSASPAVAAPVVSAPAAVLPAAVSPIAASSAEADTPPWETSESPSAPSVPDVLPKQAAPQPKQEPVAQPTATVSGGDTAPAAPPLPEGLFTGWQQVVESIVQRDASLAPFLKNTKAYIRGRYVLIDGSDLFLDFMRKSAHSNRVIKDAIYETTGVHYNIGPYKKDGDAAQRQSTAEDTLAALAQRGVEVIYKNEP